MDDQAARLRDLVGRRECKPAEAVRNTHILTVTSGKGGVGKSNFTLNFALSLVKRGYQVLVFDADIGLANIDVLLGTQAPYNLYHLLIGEKKIQEIIHEGPYGLRLVAGGSGFHDLLQLTEAELNDFADQVNSLYGYYDFIIFDTGAGLSKETLKFILAAQETIVVTTPEPTSITDAYAIIKMIHQLEHKVSFKLVINRVSSFREGRQTADKITLVAERFLHLQIPTLGFLEDDTHVSKAVKKQTPFLVVYPNASASRDLESLVDRFLNGHRLGHSSERTWKQFWGKLIGWRK